MGHTAPFFSSRTVLTGGLMLLALSAIAGASASSKELAFDFSPNPNCTKSIPSNCDVGLGPSRPQLLVELLTPLAKGEERFLIPASAGYPGRGIEVRVGRTVMSDCNVVQLAGVLQPVAGRESKHVRFWRLQGKHAGDMMSTLMLCPNRERVERQLWLPGGPIAMASSGQATVVDLPSGWTLQWRTQMVSSSNPEVNTLPERWVTAQPYKPLQPMEAHRH